MNFLFVLGFFHITKGVFSLRLSEFEVPTAVIRGDPAWLNCSYDLEKDELYSVKWYRNNVEFYRFLPSDRSPAQIYDLQGVYVDLSRSSLGHVYLKRTDLNTEGTYRCEVSAEAPSFQTVREEKEIRVYVLPKEGPTISGIRPQYQVGDEVNVTCKAGPSKPAASLRWYINGQEAPSEFEIRYYPIRYQDRLLVSVLGLRFVAEPRHFWQGAMKLRCTAVISQAYSMSSEEIIVGDHAKASAVIGDGPVIAGGKAKYQMGDTVNVNCTSSKSNPAAELRWYINDKAVRPEFLINYPKVRYHDGQEVSILGLRFAVRSRHFLRDEMRLKCTATLSKVINMSSEETTIIGSSQQSSGLHISENTEAMTNRSPLLRYRFRALLISILLAVLL